MDEYALRGHQYVKTWTLSNSLPHKKLEALCAKGGQDLSPRGFSGKNWKVKLQYLKRHMV